MSPQNRVRTTDTPLVNPQQATQPKAVSGVNFAVMIGVAVILDLLQIGLQFIPGVGQILSWAIWLIGMGVFMVWLWLSGVSIFSSRMVGRQIGNIVAALVTAGIWPEFTIITLLSSKLGNKVVSKVNVVKKARGGKLRQSPKFGRIRN
jgi:hypothetical protein